ncbi:MULTISPECIES: zinc-binding alcohol dehydrogenase [Thermocrispum]|uniref:Dehydrogenase n=1 Tax=Thermocrispum agreste TaxID=37925 RepID=A0A2W4LHM4_9PSEU|nr:MULTISPECIES: zinc-binding alcohol dehydrogenase [Thermocrispum]PZM97113.1 MAG: dehydrogenase [Thermocrispum agreste]
MTPARAFWVSAPGVGEIRPCSVERTDPDDVLVDTRYSAISRGTETLVFTGRVPVGQYEVMRAPFQEGNFGGPVKYGYLNVGVVREGPPHLAGRTVFCLYPHQTHYVVPAAAVAVVPDEVPAARAVLAGTVETAINALWDARPLIGDRVAVVGAGMVGCAVAALLAAFPGLRLQLVDVDPARRSVAEAIGAEFVAPHEAARDCDLVLHASATEQGLRTALDLLRTDGRVIELSWYGDQEVRLPLGERFHSARLSVRSSQVGTVARPDRTHAERMALALSMLRDARFDALITGESRFDDLPRVLPALADGSLPALCHRVVY